MCKVYNIMSVQHITNVRIAGISAAVPKRTLDIKNSPAFPNEKAREDFVQKVGIEHVRRHDGNMTCADMCQKAAEELMQKLGWAPDEIDLLVFSAQSREYIQPATACVLHGKMGLPPECACFDVALGCSGWVYGLSVVAGLVQGGGFKKALLLCGDSEPTGEEHPTRADLPMFGDAGTATAFVFDEEAPEIVTEMCTDGTGYEAIIFRSGGMRQPITAEALEYKVDPFGHCHRSMDMEMDGVSVFLFAIARATQAVKSMLQRTASNVDIIDYFVFHQANKIINEQIRRKCKISKEKCPLSLNDFGNTNSGTIPLTMVTRIREQLVKDSPCKIIACGFGVGLSWGAVSFETRRLVIPPLIELKETGI